MDRRIYMTGLFAGLMVFVGSAMAQADQANDAQITRDAIDTVAEALGQNKLGVNAEDLRAIANPKGKGVFVYVPRTRFLGVERYIIWIAVGDNIHPLNGATKNIIPKLLWPRDAPEGVWVKTGLDLYLATEAIEIVFHPDSGQTQNGVQ